jgi:protein-tyrosine kinase
MSKVHEALKRAQEERLEGRQAGENPQPPGTTESAESTLQASGVEEEFPSAAISFNSKHQTPPRETPAGRDTPALTGRPPLSRVEVNVISTPAIPKALAPPLAAEHRPHTPAVGRDPRTGQFLRFEDLLKSCSEPAWVHDPKTVVFASANEHSSDAEQFRTLRSRLYQLREAAPLKKILVTSALAAEGKTFVATNLAQAIAREKGRKVLLIDADLRSPALHKPLRAPLTPGISDYLRGQASDPEIIQHGHEGNLCFIPAGSPGSDPSELLSNGALEKLLERLTPLFDWVILDSPPCLPVADANVLGGLCDGVVLVVKARSTPSAAVERTRKELQKRKVLGVVMNAVEDVDEYGAYYSGYAEKYQGKGKSSHT